MIICNLFTTDITGKQRGMAVC